MGVLLVIYADVVAKGLEVAAVPISSMGICSGAAVTWGVLEKKAADRITELALIGTAAGFLVGIPLTLCAWVALERV